MEYKYRYNGPGINTINGNFYAYIVLLFNENPHFANLIQSGAIPIKDIGIQGFNIKAYRNYLSSIQDPKLQEEADETSQKDEVSLDRFFFPEKTNISAIMVSGNEIPDIKLDENLVYFAQKKYDGNRIIIYFYRNK